jgi:hypothetical protein
MFPALSRHIVLFTGAWLMAGAAASAAAQGAEAWSVIGRQGLVRLVLVPLAEAKDRAAYTREIAKLCEPEHTCFLNFYTNTQGLPAALPLPDGIAQEATATFRRSMKNGAERFWWSCRLQIAGESCF